MTRGVPLRMRRKLPQQKEEAEYIDDVNNFDEMIERRYFVEPPSGRLIVKRDGHSITRQIPKPIVLIDTCEQAPLTFSRFPNWIAGEKRQKLKIGDYSVQGMEHLLVIERKTLSDIITTVMQGRSRFFRMCD